MKPPPRIHLSPFLTIPVTTAAYAASGAIVGASAFPPALLLAWAARALLSRPTPGQLLLFCLLGGAGLYLFFLTGLLLTGLLLRAVPGGWFPIGDGTVIGGEAVICAGMTIGDGATVGIHSFLRRGARVAPGAHVAAVGALPPRATFGLEREARGDRRRPPVSS